MELLRKLKHWQLFLLVVGIPIAVQMVQNIILLTSASREEVSNPGALGLIIIVPLLVYYFWIGAVGVAFSEKNTSVNMPTGRFKFSLWISCLASIFLSFYFWTYPQNIQQADEEKAIPIMLIGVLVFVMLFTLFYCLSFMARAIVQLERGGRINSAEFYSEFVMAVFFPIGIWLLQPRINRLNKSV